ncbi:MAG: PAS domain S-box protein, partial [Bacillota bacterium]
MLNTIKQWLEPPIFPNDEEKNGLARLVNTLGLYFAFLLLLDAFIYVPFFVTQKTFALIVVAALMILYAISRLALFRGQIKLSNLILVIGTWAVFQGLSIFSGGVNVPASFVIIATIIIIRLLIQTRISYIILILSILIELCLAFLQTNKYELPTFLYFSPLSSWFWFTLTLGFVFSTVNLISHNLQDALNQAQKQHKKRDEVEQALRQSEERFRMFMQYFPGLAFMKDTDGKILFANQGFYTYLGLNPEEMIGKTNQTIFRDEFGIKISCDDQFVLESGTSQVIDENFAGKTWTTHKFCINQRDAKPLLGGIAIDTTAQKMADEALRESEARFRTLLQNVSMVSVQGYSPDGTTNYWNQASERLYGYTAQEAIGRNLLDLIIPPEMRSDVQKAIQQMTKTGQPIPGSELSLIHRDGSLVEVFSSHAIIQTPGHEPELFCIDIDLTERKRTEQALKQTQEEFLAVVQTANEAIITINEQQTITFWNTEAESIFGFSVDEMIGKPFTQIVPFHLREINKQAVKRVLAGGTMRLAGKIIEVTGLNKEGKEFPIEMSLAEWKTQTGHFITAIIRDISKRKSAEKRMEQSEKKYRELFQLNNDGITIVGLAADRTNKMFIELNEASHNMLGYSKEEMLRLSPDI